MASWQNPIGSFVVVLGPDGSGKSTICGHVLEQSNKLFGSTTHFHWRPGLLPKLRRTHMQVGMGSLENPPDVSRYKGTISFLRFVYYWVDFVIGYWIIIYRMKANGSLVLGERYFPDVLVQPERYGFALPRWLMRLAAQLIPSPDLVVLLKADPAVIHARKAELAPPRIQELLSAYEREMKHWRHARILATEGDPDAVAQRLTQMIIEERSTRTARRFE